LLILLAGSATKKAEEFLHQDKEYIATLKLGDNSTTDDIEGEISHISDEVPSRESVNEVIQGFLGEIRQRPPIYSAIKINGRRAYKLARKGVEVEMPERTVKIHEIEVLDYKYPELTIRTSVSSGTYIRSLAKDVGKELKTGAYLTALRRTKSGKFSLNDVDEKYQKVLERLVYL
jgi:tRNA pseudouridine55 synthase